MNKVLIVFPYYVPGYRAGGPLQTIRNITEAFGNRYEFYILTLNHDMGCSEKYKDIEAGWNKVGNAKVMYVSDEEYSMKLIVEVSQNVDCVYSCSLFSKQTIMSLIAKRIGKINKELIVAPMGVFSKGAISQKSFKKKLFLKTMEILGMFERITWSFSSELEKKDAEDNINRIGQYVIAEDLPRKIQYEVVHRMKEEGQLKVIFLSRICPMKNLLSCIEILDREWNGQISFDIYGTQEDMDYWELCQEKIKKMNRTVNTRYCGEVVPDKVPGIFAQYDVFLFPTLGENFGHVIYEALSVGCIPIISDRTIWQNFNEKECGKIIPLENEKEFVDAVNEFLCMSMERFEILSSNAVAYAKEKYETSISCSNYLELFG